MSKAAKILAKRKAQQLAASTPPSLFNPNFPQQEAFVKDPAKLKALFCTRRAAKSFTACLYMVHEALTNPNTNCLFIGLTRESAKNIAWTLILKVINRTHKLKAKFNEQALSMTFPNGSMIRLTGVDAHEDEMNKLLGGKYRLVCIDEASMYTISLSNLVYGVLKLATIDPNQAGDRGTICLMGTASNFARGLFYDITTNKESGWSLHQWTAHDNPYVAKQYQEELDEIKEKRPLYMETPQYRQWYLNEWVVDEDKLVYRFNETRNLYKELPKLPADGWSYVLGVDTGWEDDNAFVLTGYHINDPTLYVLKTYNKPKMTFDQVVEVIHKFMADPVMAPHKVIIDGANKQGVESMRARSNIPFEYADKVGKVDFIEQLNADLIQAHIKCHSTHKTLMDEWMSLVWKTEGDKIVLPKKEHPSLPNHLCDAMLYAWRNSYTYHFSKLKPVLPVGSKAWYDETTTQIWEKEREHIERELEQGDWPEEPGWGRY
jgi:phage terminase large subunit